ncbi:Kelch domain-containing protein 10 [Thelohanellus kitauei]|uniref:Kelch domain-containing protein 10 n=1 Tax=Thelohanellus kitauei TaxID=669202 RepID=A0A0C2MEB3_THEKT|nr:Kelch domain-containing protein 10 [Thelohanellus kitauei]
MNLRGCQAEPAYLAKYGMTSVHKFLIMYGGFNYVIPRECKELWAYNTINGIWRRYKAPVTAPNACLFPSLCAVGSIIYIFGGTELFDATLMTNSLISFNVCTTTWEILSPHTEICDLNTPPPVYGSCIFYHKEYLYVLGGMQRIGDLDAMYKFCLKTFTWSLVSQNGRKPLLTFRIFGTVFNNHGSSQINRFVNVNIFDFFTNSWTTRPTSSKTQQYPDDRNDESFTFSNNLGYLCGGKNPHTFTSYNDIWRIDLETLEWIKLDYTVQTTEFIQCTSVVNGSYLYSFEGEGNGYDRKYMLQRFTVQPPTLYRLCLESITRSPSLRNCSNYLPAAIVDELDLNNNDS